MERIRTIASCHPAAVLLREKDLTETEYEDLARSVTAICETYGVPCILHTYAEAALRLKAEAVHLPLPILRGLSEETKGNFRIFGTSCHSVEEALEAERLGCTYLIAGHIFDTDCKEDLPGRGLSFLRQVCESVSVPVLAIGGIRAENAADVRRAGAAGLCIMSSCMISEDVVGLLKSLAETDRG